MTTIYLAYGSSGRDTLLRHADEAPVNILVAIPYLDDFLKHRDRLNIGQWCLDSGAFTALNTGKEITYERWRDAARSVDACEVFGLDVIYDADATRKNLERAWADGIDAIPTFHQTEDWSALKWCCDHASKIALGGMAKANHLKRLKWIAQCFARCWPKKVHGFGCGSWHAVKTAPFHSIDASSWCLSPSRFGNWAGYTGAQMALKARKMNDFWIEVVEHQKRETWAKHRWKHELAKLEDEQ